MSARITAEVHGEATFESYRKPVHHLRVYIRYFVQDSFLLTETSSLSYTYVQYISKQKDIQMGSFLLFFRHTVR